MIIPVYKNELNIGPLLELLSIECLSYGRALEVIFVIDGSPDSSAKLLVAGLPNSRLRSKVISLSKNFGSFSAIRAGMVQARGQYIAVMAADLQEPFEVVRFFFQELENTTVDVVIGERETRSDSKLKSAQSRLFWRLYRRVINSEIPVGGVDVFGCTDKVRNQIVNLNESHSSLLALIFWVGFKRSSIPYARQERLYGKSGWTFSKKWTYMLDSVFSFTDLPVRLLLVVGSVGSVSLVFLGLSVAAARWLGAIDVPGYSALAFTILLSTSAILFGLGIVGSYSWRTFENSKNRPLFIISGEKTFNE